MNSTEIDINRELAIASLYNKRGNLAKARECYEKILAIDPVNELAEQGIKFLDLRNSKGTQSNFDPKAYDKLIAYVKSDKREEALEESQRLSTLYPADPKIAYAQGMIQLKWKMFKKAIASFRRAIGLDPEFFDAHYEMAKVFREKHQLKAAGLCFESAVKFNPEHTEANNLLALTQKDLGQTSEAEANFLRALELSPDNPGVLNNLGILYANTGRKEKARVYYEKALKVSPDLQHAHKNLTLIKKFTSDDPQLHVMEKILSRPGLSDEKKVYFCFSLAKAYEDIGDHKRCAELLKEGGRIRTKELDYSIKGDTNIVRATIENWNNGLVPDSTELEYQPISIRPIFVLGMPRSGTTLSEQILASHSQVYGAGELWEFGRLLKVELNKAGWYSKAGNAKKLTQESILSVRQSYSEFLERIGADEKIIVDKMPLNFRWIGFIKLIFPEAKIIHQNRSPMATCWSCYKFHFSDGNGFSFDQKNLAEFYNLYLDIVSFWRELTPRRFYDLNYEVLTQNQEEETRKLLDYCDLDWEEQCLSFHKTERKVSTASSQQVRQKMYTGSSEVWKKFEPYLQPLISGLDKSA